MLASKRCLCVMILAVFWITSPCSGQDMTQMPVTTDRPDHQESAREHRGGGELQDIETPPLPEGMTLDDVLDYAAEAPPEDFPAIVPDDRLYVFTLVEKLEYRIAEDDAPDHVWVGGPGLDRPGFS